MTDKNYMPPLEPEGWFYATRSTKLRRKPLSIQLYGKKYVLFRDEDGSAQCLISTCAHFGADLSLGFVKNGRIHCPFHHWAYDGSGKCQDAPGEKQIPDYACVESLRVKEKFGAVFVYQGEDEDPELPDYVYESDQVYICVEPIHVEVDADWYMAGMNEFDLRHFKTVHHRELARPADIRFLEDKTAWVDLHLKNVAPGLMARMMRRFTGEDINLQIQNLAGVMKLAKTKMKRVTNRMVISIIPTGEGRCESYIMPVAPRSRWQFVNLLIYLRLRLLRVFIKAFFMEEVREVKGARFSYERATREDRTALRYMKWLEACHPRSEHQECGKTLVSRHTPSKDTRAEFPQ